MEILDAYQVRVLGSLMEKEKTTPDYYPMTLKALNSACNQKSNRNPVMNLDETIVVRALDKLRKKGLALRVISTEYRTPKYEHSLLQNYSFSPAQQAVLCVLFLRGAQTVGELRARSARMHDLSFEDVVETLESLKDMEEGPFIIKLPRNPGQKESRYLHLFCGPPDEEMLMPPEEKAVLAVQAEDRRILVLEEEVEQLKNTLHELQNDFYAFKKEFE